MSADAAARDRSYFEDVEVGGRYETPAMTVTAAHVSLYAGVTGDELNELVRLTGARDGHPYGCTYSDLRQRGERIYDPWV